MILYFFSPPFFDPKFMLSSDALSHAQIIFPPAKLNARCIFPPFVLKLKGYIDLHIYIYIYIRGMDYVVLFGVYLPYSISNV